jgi:hypothetical protein
MISACTHKAFSHGPIPLAHLKRRRLDAVNDNKALFSASRGCAAFHSRREAYGRASLIVAMLALVAGITALPLLQGLSAPFVTASKGRPEALRGGLIAPTLLQSRRNG